ncbi:MAG: S8 family serine peptidase, partial [Bacteroidota bacterium]
MYISSRMKLRDFYALIFAMFLPAFAIGQLPLIQNPITTGSQNVTMIGSPAGLVYQQVDVPLSAGKVRLIVELDAPPLCFLMGPETSSSALLSAHQDLQDRQQTFQSDLDELEQTLVREGRIPANSTTILRQTYNVVNALTLETDAEMVAEIRQLEGVKAVHHDSYEKAVIDIPSNAAINLPCFISNNPGTTGNGIRVGIIDTGVDYNHPALGGGFGTGFKVAGGYDFVANDPNPIDGSGHGTHVAGIVASSSTTYPGVAPDATLWAYRVVNSQNQGWASDVIAAIDASVDPDGIPSTPDALDVINMSLRWFHGSAVDLIAIASDNASNAGVIVVAGVGNEGPGYFTIGSPAASEEAISVGAVDNAGTIANFSSRGPSRHTFGLKPDIVAPGVNVVSTVPQGNFLSLSGTSMASPHVAGVAALLRSIYPNRSPREIKSMIMQSATDVGYDVLTQGQGLVDVCSAEQVNGAITPGSLDFGLVDCGQSSTLQKTLTFHNYSGSNQTYNLSLSTSNLPTGASVSLSTSSVNVAPGGTATALLTLTTTSALPFANTPTQTYIGEVLATQGGTNYTVPFSFSKKHSQEIHFDDDVEIVFIHDGNFMLYANQGVGAGVFLTLQPGTYDIVVVFRGRKRIVVREGVVFNGCLDTMNISSSEAIHEWTLQTVFEDGTPWTQENRGGLSIVHKGSLAQTVYAGGGFIS